MDTIRDQPLRSLSVFKLLQLGRLVIHPNVETDKSKLRSWPTRSRKVIISSFYSVQGAGGLAWLPGACNCLLKFGLEETVFFFFRRLFSKHDYFHILVNHVLVHHFITESRPYYASRASTPSWMVLAQAFSFDLASLCCSFVWKP